MQKGKVDTVALILRLSRADNGVSKKKLQDESNLTVELLNDHLSTMVSKNLIEYVNAKSKRKEDVIIRITERGVKFLDLYDAIKIKYLTIE